MMKWLLILFLATSTTHRDVDVMRVLSEDECRSLAKSIFDAFPGYYDMYLCVKVNID
jgi:hypothetical protein